MSRRPKPLPVGVFRKVERPRILKVLGEVRGEFCGSPIPFQASDRILASDLTERTHDMAELLTRDQTQFHLKMHS
jgi:hypothetical protein